MFTKFMRRIYRLSISLFLFVLVAGCDPVVTADEHIANAKNHSESGRFNSAIIELKSALQLAPGNADARWQLGLIYLELGDGASAEKELERALKLGEDSEALKIAILRAKLIQSKFNEVVDETRDIFHLDDSLQAQILALRGNALLGLNEIELASDAFEFALSLVATEPEAGLGKAKISALRNEKELVEKWINFVVKEHPQYAPAWSLLGDFERYQKNADAAEMAYSKAISYRQDSAEDIYKRAQIRIYKNKIEEARNDLNSVRKIIRPELLAYSDGLIYFLGKDYGQALPNFQRAVQNDYMPAVFYLGFTQYLLGSYGQAESSLRRYLNHHQSDVASRILADTRLALGDFNGAKSVLEPVLARNPNDLETLKLMGQISLGQGNLEKGIDYLKEIVDLSPESIDTFVQLGLNLEFAGDSQHGLDMLEQAVASENSTLKAELAVVLAYLRSGQYDKAIESAKRSHESYPQDPDPLTLLGGALVAKGDIDGARSAFESALEVDPGASSAANNLALMELRLGNTEAARVVYAGILEYDADHLPTLLNFARLEIYQGNPDQGVKLLRQAIKAYPQTVRPRVMLARYYLAIGQPARALSITQDLDRSLADHPSILGVLGEAKLASQQAESAINYFQKLILAAPNSAQAHYQLAKSYSAVNQFELSRAELEKALELDKDHYGANYTLVRLLVEEAKVADAVALYKKMRAIYPNIPELAALGGWLKMREGKNVEAIAIFNEVLKVAPDPEIVVFLARSLYREGDTKAATETLSNWISSRPMDSGVQFELANTYLLAGKLAEAMAAFERFIELVPTHALALNNLAWLKRNDDPEKALELAEKALDLSRDNPFIMDTLGEILLDYGQTDRAVRMFERAASKMPENPNFSYHLALALVKSNEVEKSKAILADLIRSPKQFKNREAAKSLLESL